METKGKVVGIESYFVKGRLDAHLIRVKANLEFQPGQYVMVAEEGFRLKADPSQLKWTSYSIASSPLEKGYLDFVYTIKYTGGFTQYLAENLAVGSHLLLKGPYGRFTLQENGREKVFVATGAGIAPIMSMIRTLDRQGFPRPARLFYGFRTGEHFLCRRELEAISSGNFGLFTTISREDPSWKGHRGYVQSLLGGEFRPGEQEVYICGNPEMVRDVKKFFLGKGFAEENVKVEQW